MRQILFQNGQNIEKIIPENKKSTKCCIYSKLKARIYLLFYCVKHVRRQFKTDLKLGNIRFKQLAKAFPAIWKSCAILFKRNFVWHPINFPICILYDTISFDMSCFHCAVWYSDRCAVYPQR
jgi:hypothetical protein